MSTFTLDDIRAAADAKYGSTDIDLGDRVVKLLNPLRLPKTNRNKLREVQDQLGAEDADQEQLLADALALVAESPAAAKRLLTELGGDLGLLVEVFGRYTEGTQVGEA
jgi:hypothetical protein